MSFVSQFNLIKTSIDGAVQSALPTLAEGLKRKIAQKATENVYSYGATGSAMAKRRYTIGSDGNLQSEIGTAQVTIVNTSTMQGGMGHEVEMVEEGWSEFRQPGPRPFMDDALDEFVAGEGQETLARVMREHGFTVM